MLQIGGILLGLYVGRYIVLSINGRYAPGSISLSGPRYTWFPKGFAQGKVGYLMADFYCPLWALDWNIWHRSFRDKDEAGDYPVTDVNGWGPND